MEKCLYSYTIKTLYVLFQDLTKYWPSSDIFIHCEQHLGLYNLRFSMHC